MGVGHRPNLQCVLDVFRESKTMVVFVVILCIFLPCSSLDWNARPRSRAKVVEDYILSANFDGGMAPPQIRGRAAERPEERGMDRKMVSQEDFRHAYQTEEEPTAPGPYHDMKDRDLVLSPHHPPPPAFVISPQAFFAMGFINFLIVISIMQASIAVMSKRSPPLGGLLGGLLGMGKPSRRRRRSASDSLPDLR